MPRELLEKAPGVVELGRPGWGGIPRLPDDGDGGDGQPDEAKGTARFGLWLFLGTLSMLFIGFSSAYVVRRASADWGPLSPPPVLWLNSAVLMASSVTLQRARRKLEGWDLQGMQGWLLTAGALAALFLTGQVLAWRALAGRGLYLASSPHSSFFFVLSGLHAAHLLAGLVWFAVVQRKVRRLAYTPGEDALGLFATYWHFLTGLWLYLFVLLFIL